MKNYYENIRGLILVAKCTSISQREWDKYMEGHTRADIKKVNRLLKKFVPEDFEAMRLDLYNPYYYYKTEKHIVVVWSSIEHFYEVVR